MGDTITLTCRDDGAIARTTELPGVAPQDDLVVRAAMALRQATGGSQGVDIAVTKRIPLGGGLGGGSSDAATVLLALNRLWGARLPRAELMRIGLALGADVPVLSGRRAGARARHRRAPDSGIAAGAVGGGDRARHCRVDGIDLRGTGIDTRHRVGENGRLFRGLWPE